MSLRRTVPGRTEQKISSFCASLHRLLFRRQLSNSTHPFPKLHACISNLSHRLGPNSSLCDTSPTGNQGILSFTLTSSPSKSKFEKRIQGKSTSTYIQAANSFIITITQHNLPHMKSPGFDNSSASRHLRLGVQMQHLSYTTWYNRKLRTNIETSIRYYLKS
jgi:hypothetical protein